MIIAKSTKSKKFNTAWFYARESESDQLLKLYYLVF